MKYNPDRHHRQSIRLKGHDYSQTGVYFITICTQNMECLFGEVVDGKMVLNDGGRIVQKCWLDIPEHFTNVQLDESIIMPDHFHGIIVITEGNMKKHGGMNNRMGLIHQALPRTNLDLTNQGLPNQGLMKQGLMNQTPTENNWILMNNDKITLSHIVRHFKAKTSKIIHEVGRDEFSWQHNYYDEIIRNENQLNETRKYIINNPIEWELKKKNARYFKTM